MTTEKRELFAVLEVVTRRFSITRYRMFRLPFPNRVAIVVRPERRPETLTDKQVDAMRIGMRPTRVGCSMCGWVEQ